MSSRHRPVFFRLLAFYVGNSGSSLVRLVYDGCSAFVLGLSAGVWVEENRKGLL